MSSTCKLEDAFYELDMLLQRRAVLDFVIRGLTACLPDDLGRTDGDGIIYQGWSVAGPVSADAIEGVLEEVGKVLTSCEEDITAWSEARVEIESEEDEEDDSGEEDAEEDGEEDE